ncbi:hypothetical protein NDU88_003366 [Pleurodeles waltl]|uniref:Reverse transcriptase domain-containing protein n=1 Tax=Pleurodeles waltl TaxID=8319 RepID=A0AAV7M374_PLEWA|nr:hypothetical protein NDU88_003366 [Pleurodeles waltl]
MIEYPDRTNLPKLPSADRGALSAQLTIGEIKGAIRDVARNKTLGSDGLPNEFYKTYMHKDLGQDLTIVADRLTEVERLSGLQVNATKSCAFAFLTEMRREQVAFGSAQIPLGTQTSVA